MRDSIPPTIAEDGDEEHPAFATVNVNRASVSPPGASLFDSEIQHAHVVTLKISTASRKRGLHHDWIHPDRQIVEIMMSEAQWGGLVSSFGDGAGTPVTLTYTREDGVIPSIEQQPRLALSAAETRNAANEAVREVEEAMAAYKAHKTVGNLRTLQARIDNLPSNLEFAAKSLTEHTERVVQKARADIEAMVVNKASALGLSHADTEEILALTSGATA